MLEFPESIVDHNAPSIRRGVWPARFRDLASQGPRLLGQDANFSFLFLSSEMKSKVNYYNITFVHFQSK